MCADQEEAIKLLCQKGTRGLLQACIRTIKAEIMRVKWTPAGLEVFLIRETDLEKHHIRHSRPTLKVEVSKYQHKPSDFVYAGKLLRSSFSPYSPFRSVLSSEPGSLPGSLSPRYAPISRDPVAQLLGESDYPTCEVYKLESSYPAVAALGSVLASVLTSWKRLPKGAVTEIVFDCVLGKDNSFYVTRCLGYSTACLPLPTDVDRKQLTSPLVSPRSGYVKASKNDQIEFYAKTFGMTKDGSLPFKIIGVRARNHEPLLHTSYEDKLDPLLRAQKLRRKPPQTAPDAATAFINKIENNLDELMLRVRQSKVDLDTVRKIMGEVIKDASFGERIFFSFFERCRGIPSVMDIFSNRPREQIESMRRKFISTLQDVDLLTTTPKTRPTALSLDLTNEQYLQLDLVLQKVLRLEDLPRMVASIIKERIFLMIGDLQHSDSG